MEDLINNQNTDFDKLCDEIYHKFLRLKINTKYSVNYMKHEIDIMFIGLANETNFIDLKFNLQGVHLMRIGANFYTYLYGGNRDLFENFYSDSRMKHKFNNQTIDKVIELINELFNYDSRENMINNG